MESIFLPGLTITGNGKKNVLLREFRECRRAAQLRKQRAAEIERQRFEQGKIHQQSLRIRWLTRKNLFGEIIEDVAFRLPQNLVQVQHRRPVCRMHLLFGNLTYQLKCSYPSLGSPAILGYLFVFQLNVERLFEQLFHFFVSKEQIVARDHQRSGLRFSRHGHERRKVAGRYDQMDKVRRILQQPIDELVNDGVPADVVIDIQNKNKWLLDRLQNLVYQQVGRSFRKAKHLLVSFAQVWKDSFAECRIEIPDALRYITEEHDGVCVGVVELIPNRRAYLAANKVSDQSGFAASRICRNHCDGRAEVGLQLRCEPRAPQ